MCKLSLAELREVKLHIACFYIWLLFTVPSSLIIDRFIVQQTWTITHCNGSISNALPFRSTPTIYSTPLVFFHYYYYFVAHILPLLFPCKENELFFRFDFYVAVVVIFFFFCLCSRCASFFLFTLSICAHIFVCGKKKIGMHKKLSADYCDTCREFYARREPERKG